METRYSYGKGQFFEGEGADHCKIRNTVHVRRRCGLLSNYFGHLVIFAVVFLVHLKSSHLAFIVSLPWYPVVTHAFYMTQLECGPMPNVIFALSNIGGALCSTPQSLADAHY